MSDFSHKKRAKIVTIASRKGGVGKTVVTSLLARYYSEIMGKKVLVIDFDPRAGITSMLYKKPITNQDLTIAEVLEVAFQQGNIQDAFKQAIKETGLENSKNWQVTEGKLYLVPAKPALESVLIGKNSSLLKYVLHNLGLSDEYIVLVDSGSDSNCVIMATGAADVIFMPLIYSRQDVHPAVETLRTIIMEQRGNGRAVLGGFVINHAGDAQWEQKYHNRYVQIFEDFKKKTEIRVADELHFFRLKPSRTIKRGSYLDWSFREDYLAVAKQMAAAVEAVEAL